MLANAGGDPRAAQAALTRALALLRDRTDDDAAALRIRADITMALARLGEIGIDAATAALEDATERARGLGQTGLVMLARIQQAGLVARVGRWGEAVQLLEGIEADGRFVGARELSAASVNRGLARQYLGDVTGSEADLREALDVARAGGCADLAAIATHNLGCLALLTGDVPEALSLLQTAAADAAAGADGIPWVSPTATGLDIARAHIEAGLVDDAVDRLWSVLRVATRRGLPHARGEILLELARCALIARDPARAARYAASASAVFTEQQAQAWRRRAETLAIQSSLEAACTDSDEERVIGQRALALAEELKGADESPASRHDAECLAAEAALRLGDLPRSERHLARAREHRQPQLTARLHRDLLDASLADARGDLDRRRLALRQASSRIVSASGRYSGLDARTALALHGRRLASLDLRVALDTGAPGAVLEATERWRALSLLAPAVRPSDDPVLRDLTGELRLLTAKLEDSAAHRGELAARWATLERAINDRERTLAAAHDRAIELTPTDAGPLREQLAENDTRCVSFFVRETDLYAVSLGPSGDRIRRVGPVPTLQGLARRLKADLSARSLGLPVPLRAVIDDSCRHTLAALDHELAPALDGPETRLVIVPSWATPSMPWRMLSTVQQRPLVVAPSATFWLARRGPTHVARMVAVAGPGIARSDDEAVELARIWPSADAIRGAEATADHFTEALRDADVVHVAAHGRHDEAAPHFSSVRLVDGPAFAHEFQRVGVGAAHVVLASCDSARAQIRSGDEALGLAASLLTSGVRSVLAAVAPVDDSQTHEVMTAYHRGIAAGLDTAAALEATARGIPDGVFFAIYGADWSAAL